MEKIEASEAVAGDIILIAGLPDIDIGETVTTDANVEPLPAIAIDEATICLNFLVNNSPFAGREGKYVTSRQLREYLERELEVNVGLKVDFSSPDNFRVSGRTNFTSRFCLKICGGRDMNFKFPNRKSLFAK